MSIKWSSIFLLNFYFATSLYAQTEFTKYTNPEPARIVTAEEVVKHGIEMVEREELNDHGDPRYLITQTFDEEGRILSNIHEWIYDGSLDVWNYFYEGELMVKRTLTKPGERREDTLIYENKLLVKEKRYEIFSHARPEEMEVDTEISFSYDEEGKVTQISEKKSTGERMDFEIEYRPKRRAIGSKMSNQEDMEFTKYKYRWDKEDHLIYWKMIPQSDTSAPMSVSYDVKYDKAGNVVRQRHYIGDKLRLDSRSTYHSNGDLAKVEERIPGEIIYETVYTREDADNVTWVASEAGVPSEYGILKYDMNGLLLEKCIGKRPRKWRPKFRNEYTFRR